MGAKQSLENQTSSPQKDIVQSIQSSPSETSPSSSISADVKFDATTSSKHSQAGDNLIINDMKFPVSAESITTATYHHEQALRTLSIGQSSSESTSSTQRTLILINVVKFQAATKKASYSFREKVRHLPPDVRKADITEDIENTEVWSESQSTFDIGKCALSQRLYKRCNRTKADPWRRYGALRNLHEIGGTGCTPPNQDNPRMPQNFYQIEAGSIPPPPPS
ncbi:hypothetical protein KIN20_014346 [Parelaphostrongylus tenuis]|uniref:Uncharacterized protein n=1 Tax=Parelaphostrongylus tenuis TaxID=148309 RepID=A0AAD5MEU2_PARTN|nr:hypothetical protein KIN20_014346 [Parelaphostrongylus tenuis]